MRLSTGSRIGRLADALALGALIGVVGYLLAVSDRGFDITDEGSYLLGARNPDDIVFATSMEPFYAARLFRLVDYDIVAFRRLGMLLLLASSALLAVAVARMVALLQGAPRAAYARFVAFCGLGALLYYSWFLPTPSYNTLNAIALNCALGLLLTSLHRQLATAASAGSPSAALAALAAGAFVGVSFFVKFPTGVVSLAGLGALCVVWPGMAPRRSLRLVACFAAGFAAWSIVHFTAVHSPTEWWQMMRQGFEAVQILTPDYTATRTLTRYLQGLRSLAADVLRVNGLFLLALFGLYGWRRLHRSRPASWRAWIATAAVGALGVAVYPGLLPGLHAPGGTSIYKVASFHAGALSLLGLGTLALRAGSPRRGEDAPARRRRWLGSLLLALTLGLAPFAFMVGTGNPIGFVTLFQSSWFALYAWMFLAMERTPRSGVVVAAGTLLVVAFAASQIVLGSWRHPYRLAGDLGTQSVPTPVGAPPTTLMLDAPTSRFFDRVRRVLEANGFRQGSDILNLFKVQGVIYAVGGRSPGKPFLAAEYPGSKGFVEMVLAEVPPERLRRAFILQTSDSSRGMPSLDQLGLDFPAGYVLCDELPIPYTWTEATLRVWKPAS